MDRLKAFVDEWVENPEFKTPHETPVVIDGSIIGTVLYRKNEYQIQLFTVKPNTVIPPHSHPNVDSMDIYLSGDIEFWVDQDQVLKQEEHGPTEDGTSRKMGRSFRVLPGQEHSAKIGAKGGAFLSFQLWLKDKPTNVGDDWLKHSEDDRRNYGEQQIQSPE
jgi:mannose-6-phosphate isomerase-like protein (cupin superfamily)